MAAAEPGCPRCGATLPPDARYCAACGHAKTRLVPGQVLDGKYEILDKLGEGGMGEVYRARHVHLDEIRVIKVTKPDAGGENAEPRRFQEEARLATRVRHPNVATLFDFSRLPDGSYYMVWEFIDGVTLEERVRDCGALPAARAIEISRQVLAGLAEIHAQGIVHRDLSPDNILLRETPGGDVRAKIIDLGVAKRISAESLRMTGTGMFVGKLKYCSPEQAGSLPRGQTVDARSDLYSFGVVLYEMLAGKPPFESESPEGYIGQHLHARAPALDLSLLPAATGAALARVVERALQKSRDRRFQSAEEFRTALDRIGSTAQSGLAERTTGAESTETRKARRGISTVAIAAAVLLFVAAAAAFRIVNRPRRSPVAAQPAAQRTESSSAGTGVPDPAPDAPAGSAPSPAETGDGRRSSGRTVDDPAEPGDPAAASRDEPAAPTGRAEPESSAAPDSGAAEATRLRNRFEEWNAQSLDEKARGAGELAVLANTFVAARPRDPLSAQMRERLPAALASLARRSLDERKSVFANLFREAYRRLAFAPADPELERKVRND